MIELMVIILFIVITLFVIIYYPFFSPSSQILGKVIYSGHQSDEKVVALTFDDGPNEPYTSQILDILKKYRIKATFFPVGENIIGNNAVIKRIFNEGHIVGNHSYSHAFFAPIISPNYKKEMEESQNIITRTIGHKPMFFRPPWFFRTSSMLKTAKKLGLITTTGTFGSYWEVFKVSPEKIARDAIKNTHPGTILVFHDGYNNKGTNRSKTVQALEIVIPRLQKLGYKFVTVDRV